MDSLTVSYLQLDLVWENSEANLKQIEIEFSKLDISTDLVILPEMFNTGFSMSSSKLAQPMNGKVVEAIKSWSNQYNFAIVGSFICQEQEHYFNRLVFVHPDGKVEKYDKRHLFRMANETDYFSPGVDRLIVNYKGWKIMPLVCYDLRFPVWSRNQFQVENEQVISEYDLLIYVANWPAARIAAWNKLLLARAIENQSYVIGVNRTGLDGKEIPYNGHSASIDAKGDYLIKPLEDVVDSQTVRLDKKSLEEFRAKFPVGMDADSFKVTSR
jgi:predicted amidohydrolase